MDLRQYKKNLEKLNMIVNLGFMCQCGLNHLSQEIEKLEKDNKEELLALIYLESLLQGMVFTYDNWNYSSYIERIGGMRITMHYHGSYETQFRLMLKMQKFNSSYDESKLHSSVHQLGLRMLPKWFSAYREKFGVRSAEQLIKGLEDDKDISKLVCEFPFLKEPLQQAFSSREVA